MNTLYANLGLTFNSNHTRQSAHNCEHIPSVNIRSHNTSQTINASLVAKQSVFLGGLGQVRLGQNVKGFSIMVMAFVGFICGFLPGIVITILGIVDAYVMASRLNENKVLGRWDFFWHKPQ